MQYVYPAIFTSEAVGGYSIGFPDVEGCYTQGEDLIDGILMAKDALALMLCGYEEDNKPVPPATPIEKLKVDKGSFATLILTDTTGYPVLKVNDDEQYQETA